MNDLVDKLQQKIKTQKQQIEDAVSFRVIIFLADYSPNIRNVEF